MKNCGYTLIELLVVLVIIGLTLGAVALRLAAPDERRALWREAERFARVHDLAGAQATALGLPVELRISAEGYDFQPIRTGRLDALRGTAWLKPRRLPAGMTLALTRPAGLEDQPLRYFPGGDHGPATLRMACPDRPELAPAVMELPGHGPVRWRSSP